MARQPEATESTSSASAPQTPGERTLRGWVRTVGRCALVVGCALVVVAFFAPWFDLSSSMSGLPRDQYVGPWTLVAGSGGVDLLPRLACLVLPVGVMLGGSLGLLRARRAHMRSQLFQLSLLLCMCSIFVALFVVVVLPTGLALGYPYYDVSYEYGIWLALVGLGLLFVGIVSAPMFSAQS